MSESPVRGDVRISGAGAIATGTYRTVSVSGSATLVGEIDCINFKVSGAAEGEGSLVAESMVVNGTLGYRGDARAKSVRVNGTAQFGALDGGKVSVAGTLGVRELRATEATVLGYLDVAGDCSAERFRSEGGFTIGGLLNAGVVEIGVYARCSALEIGGEAVTVKGAHGSLRRLVAALIPAAENRLTVEVVEGDDVRLEQTTARAVRGRTVVIGQGCQIDLVEYSGEYSASPDAKIKQVRKLGSDEKGADS